MLKRLWFLLVAASLSVAVVTQALPYAHYVNGVEGLKGASIPPPGKYLISYNVFYEAPTMRIDDDEAPFDFDLQVLATVQRMIFISDKKLFGGNLGMDVSFPIVHSEIDVAGVGDSDTGIGDINIEPLLLAWHGKQWDVGGGYSIYLPTGHYEADEPGSVGKGYYTHMFTFGGTYFFDQEKTWHASVLGRYEIHGEQEDTQVTPGDDFHFEWGLGKSLRKGLDVGLVGYCQWQVTDDEGDNAVNPDVHDRAFAVGPEVSCFVPSWKTKISLRHTEEFDVIDRSDGRVTTLTLTKIF